MTRLKIPAWLPDAGAVITVPAKPHVCPTCKGAATVTKLTLGFGSVSAFDAPCTDCAGAGFSFALAPVGFGPAASYAN
jgi:hypothetical protein